MNTYYISGKSYYFERYVVEAENEDEAKQEVEWGNVDCEDRELDYVDDLVVDDVDYGNVERSAKLGLTFFTCGEIREQDIQDALYSLLQGFDGKTASYGDAELGIVGFSVDHVEEV